MHKDLIQKTVLKLVKCFLRSQTFGGSHATNIHLAIKLNLVDTVAWFDRWHPHLCAHRERVCRHLFDIKRGPEKEITFIHNCRASHRLALKHKTKKMSENCILMQAVINWHKRQKYQTFIESLEPFLNFWAQPYRSLKWAIKLFSRKIDNHGLERPRRLLHRRREHQLRPQLLQRRLLWLWTWKWSLSGT